MGGTAGGSVRVLPRASSTLAEGVVSVYRKESTERSRGRRRVHAETGTAFAL